ncbi:MAG TPA: KpsF/GutQ family sugar-phosphate isomerase [Steroidobacteraceae bacterium]|nr:KpsF/GutQ family sugar-phosphate isomerase [Steroidobacteraceae bacterium]
MTAATSARSVDDATLLTAARRALAIEARAVDCLGPRLGAEFVAACRLCLQCTGRVIVTGIGKSGHVGRKIAATLASTGTPAFFLHAAEASHGDLGMITATDVVLALSNSGESPELVFLLPHLKRLATPLVTLTGNLGSTLARSSTIALEVTVPEEACPLNLAPTASTTAMLAMGDALAVTLLEARGFTATDFARSHPGGSLGRKVFLRVQDIMRQGAALPRTAPTAALALGLQEMTQKGLGATIIVDAGDRVLGIFTDGDLRRLMARQADITSLAMQDVMTTRYRSIGPQELAAVGVQLMDQHRITMLPVLEDGRLTGAINAHDLLRAGVM